MNRKRVTVVIPIEKNSEYGTEYLLEERNEKTRLKKDGLLHSSSTSNTPSTSSSWKSTLLNSIDLTLQSLLFLDHKISILTTDENKYTSQMKPKKSLVSWHNSKSYIAVSNEATIGIFDMKNGVWLEPLLSHSAMSHGGIYCIQWCADSDAILVGTHEGISCWRLYSLHEQSTEQSWMQYLYHPRKRPVHSIDISSHGRVFASMTFGENLIYIWDGSLATFAPLYCVDGLGCSLKWCPGGSALVVSDQFGGVDLVDTYSWQHESCCTVPTQVSFLCWLGDKNCIFVPKDTKSLYSFEILYSERVDIEATAIQVQPVPTPIDTSSFDHGETLVVSDMKSEDKTGRYVAISFSILKSNEDYELHSITVPSSSTPILPLVAIYMVNLKPIVSLSLLRVITPIVSDKFDINLQYTIENNQEPIVPYALCFGSSSLPLITNDPNTKSVIPRNSSDEDWIMIDDSELPEDLLARQRTSYVHVAVTWSNGSLTVDSIN